MFKQASTSVYFILGIIFVAALFLRLYNLSEFPVGFHIDEASLGYNGYSLLLTGKDENNNRFPLYIDMFGDNRPSGYHYLTILPIKIFGLNEFATRLPGALFGSITVFAIFFLTLSIFQNRKLGLLTALFLAISPWHIGLSRASSETIVALFFILLGFSLVIVSLKKEKITYIIAGTVILSLSFFFYHTPRVFVPLFFIILAAYSFPIWLKARNYYRNGFIVSLSSVTILALVLIFLVRGGVGRFNQVNIFGFPETELVKAEQIREDGMAGSGIVLTRMFHNKIINYSLSYASNYFEYFTGGFLFIKGGLPNWYSIPGIGLIYLTELPFFLIGFVLLATHKKHSYKIPVIWLFVAPMTAAVTMDDVPNLQRAIVMFPVIEIIAAYGFISLIRWRNNVKHSATIFICAVFSVLIIFNFIYFLHQYFVHTKAHRTWYRNNGSDEMIRTVSSFYNDYDKIIITKGAGGIYPLILFYTKFDPVLYQKEGSSKDKEYTGFGKFFFVPQSCPSVEEDDKFLRGRFIYVDNGTCPDNKDLNDRKKAFINKEDGTRAFKIVYD